MIFTSVGLGLFHVIGDSVDINKYWAIVNKLRSKINFSTRSRLQNELFEMGYITDRINQTCLCKSWYFNKDKRPCKHLQFVGIKDGHV